MRKVDYCRLVGILVWFFRSAMGGLADGDSLFRTERAVEPFVFLVVELFIG